MSDEQSNSQASNTQDDSSIKVENTVEIPDESSSSCPDSEGDTTNDDEMEAAVEIEYLKTQKKQLQRQVAKLEFMVAELRKNVDVQKTIRNVIMINLLQCIGFFLIIVQAQSINCQKTHENHKAALFARPEAIQKAEALQKAVVQNISTPMDKAVENILKWLQLRYEQRNRIARQELANMRSPNYTMRPQPFSVTRSSYDIQPGYPAFTYPTIAQFNAYNQTQYPSQTTQQNTQPYQYPASAPSGPPYQYPPASDNPLQYPTSAVATSNTPPSTPYQYRTPPPSTPFQYPSSMSNTLQQQQFYTTSSEPPYTYLLPDSQNPDIDESTDANAISLAQSDLNTSSGTTTPTAAAQSESTLVTDENSIDELETKPAHQAPHIHSIDVQCSRDRMTINLEFNEVYNGIIYSKGFYSDANCRYVKPNSGQIKYSFIVQLNTCGTQFVDEFYKGKQAFLENVLVLQNEPGIQEAWDTIRSVRCLWEGSIKQTLSAGLNVETLNQDILTFSGDMIAARLEIQVGKGPNAPAANGLVKIGETMTLVVTVDGDAMFDILVRSCTATDGNPNSGNQIQLTDDQGCILKPKLFGNFQMMKNPDPSRPSVVAFAYFQAFKFPDVMDLLIECNVELCKTRCQTCNTQPTSEPVRQKRHNLHLTTATNMTKSLSEKLRVISSDDMKYVSALALRDNYHEGDNQICLSETTFYLQNIITATFFFSSVIVITSFWMKMKRLTEKSRIFL